jgi:preprotein translocase subunit SecY
LTVVIPTLEEWSKEGAEGAKKINKINRYAAVVLGVIQAMGMAYGLRVAIE